MKDEVGAEVFGETIENAARIPKPQCSTKSTKNDSAHSSATVYATANTPEGGGTAANRLCSSKPK